MTFEESEERVSGLWLRRYAWSPEGKPRGGVVLIHGLGDYLLRYEPVARFFAERGYACEGYDMPGHGHSHGQRGHIPDWEMLPKMLDGSLNRLRCLSGEGESGLFAHSMGAYAALDYLSRRAGQIRFAWLSAPLLRPSHGRPDWLLRLADPLGRWLPRFPYDTGVRAVDCVTEGALRLEDRAFDPLLHHVTTLGFGRELVSREGAIWRGALELGGDLDLLITHGTHDLVCPYGISREFFESLSLERKRFVSLEGERHEPLHGNSQAAVLAAAARWLEERIC